MVTQGQINSEIDLAKRIYLYYFDKFADLSSIGSDKYMKWYKDLCSIYFIVEAMLAVYILDDKLYIGDTEINEDYWRLMTLDIREYLTYDIREVVYSELDGNGNLKNAVIPAIPPTVVTYQGFIQDWRSVIINVDYDDQSTLTLPFNVNDTDPDSIRVTVNDNDPIHLVQPNEEGCHIVNNILYWHTYYNLKAGDRVFIQYLINNNATGISPGLYIETATSVNNNHGTISTWYASSVNGLGTYFLNTQDYSGYAYVYITAPQSFTATIYDELGFNVTSTFTYVGTRTLSSGAINRVYRKNSQFDTSISLSYTIKLS